MMKKILDQVKFLLMKKNKGVVFMKNYTNEKKNDFKRQKRWRAASHSSRDCDLSDSSSRSCSHFVCWLQQEQKN